ncbi:MAG: Asp-tRNA(Asn)/Glu-tRNA(Gln) amidotransferase subunit GatC [Candidatus Bipolaricaulaceae bacterium]
MIDDALMVRIEALAGLQLSPAQRQALKEELGKILNYFQKLGELDTAGVPPFEPLPGRRGAARPDEPTPGLSAQEALASAPDRRDDYFFVPPVFEP